MIEYAAVALGPILIAGYILYLHVQYSFDEIKRDWVQYRCNPLYMPFAGQMREDVSASENFQYCTSLFAKATLDIAMDPLYSLFALMTGIFEPVLESLQSMLHYIASLGTFITSFVDDTFKKLETSFSVLALLMGRIRTLVSRITSSAFYGITIMQTMVSFVIAVVSFLYELLRTLIIMIFALGIILVLFFPALLAFFIPLGALFGLSFNCFHPDTIVSTQRGEIPISDVMFGDRIQGSKVTTVFFFKSEDVPLFVYDGVIVSGEHLVRHKGQWMYVKDTGCKPYTGETPPYIVCLNTSNNRIPIGDSLFADYEETSSKNALAKIEEIVWGEPVYQSYLPGLSPDTTVQLRDGTTIRIEDIKLGMKLVEGTVTGIAIIDGCDVEWYKLGESVVSGCQPIYLNGRKYLAKMIGDYIRKDRPEIAIQIFLENKLGWFMIDDSVSVRDYPDSHDKHILEAVQNVVLADLNKK